MISYFENIYLLETTPYTRRTLNVQKPANSGLIYFEDVYIWNDPLHKTPVNAAESSNSRFFWIFFQDVYLFEITPYRRQEWMLSNHLICETYTTHTLPDCCLAFILWHSQIQSKNKDCSMKSAGTHINLALRVESLVRRRWDCGCHIVVWWGSLRKWAVYIRWLVFRPGYNYHNSIAYYYTLSCALVHTEFEFVNLG